MSARGMWPDEPPDVYDGSLDAEPDEFVDCEVCGGEGGWYEAEVRFSRWHLDPPGEIFHPCAECFGRGLVEGHQFLSINDLEERCGDFAA